MTKYIVKNCPCYEWGGCHYEHVEHECCSKNADCPIKQVVELVKQYNEAYETMQRPIPTLNKQILQTLQVEEVE